MTASKILVKRSTARVIMLIIYLMIAVYSCAQAQTIRVTTVGAEFSSTTLSTTLFKRQTISRGAGVGFFAGNRLMILRLKPLNYHNSVPSSDKKFRMLSSEVIFNFHPLEFARTRKNVLDIYLLTGFSANNFRFPKAESYTRQVFPGSESIDGKKALVITQTSGFGIEYSVLPRLKFFGEITFVNDLYVSLQNAEFEKLNSRSSTALTLGLRLTKQTLNRKQ